MERQTINLILPESKAKVILYTYISNGQFRQIQKELFKDIKAPSDPAEIKKVLANMSASRGFDQQDIALRFLIKEAFYKDGKKVENIDEFLFDLRVTDGNILYDKVREALEESNLKPELKKK